VVNLVKFLIGGSLGGDGSFFFKFRRKRSGFTGVASFSSVSALLDDFPLGISTPLIYVYVFCERFFKTLLNPGRFSDKGLKSLINNKL
jgi:hypothetical protein